MKNGITNKLFIYAFLFLYILVAFISFCHAIEFFDIGNVHWMSVMLAFAFELGLAVCLASILIGTNKKNNITWILLTILVLVQVVGNTYSVFKFISESGYEYYNYLAKPMLFMIEEVSQETVQIIISWIMGAILPVVALLMTEMVANGIKEEQTSEIENSNSDVHIENNKTMSSVVTEKDDHELNEVRHEVNEDPEVIDEQINDNDLIDNDDMNTNSHENDVEEQVSNDAEEEHDEQPHVESDESTSNREYGLSRENHKKFVAVNKEPKTMFDELKKESLN